MFKLVKGDNLKVLLSGVALSCHTNDNFLNEMKQMIFHEVGHILCIAF